MLSVIFEGVNTLATAWSLGRAAAQPASELRWPQILGFGLVLAGLALETGAEEQRWRFKKDAANKGQLHSSGALGRLSRHSKYSHVFRRLWRRPAPELQRLHDVASRRRHDLGLAHCHYRRLPR